MTDSDRLDARLDQAVRRRAARTNDPARIGPALADAVAELARKHVTNPHDFRPATDAEMDAKQHEIDMEMLRRKAEILLSGLPSRYRNADYIPGAAGHQAAQWVTDYREGGRNSLVILGPVGTGKTWLAAAIAHDLLINVRPVPVTMITVSEMLANLRPTPGLDVDIQQFILAPVLILDDLGQENQTPWTQEQMYRLSHARYHNGRPTIVTSNLSGEEIKNTYESRTVQRLFGGARLIELAGQSRRELPF
jgi:DNA replication protein DnaC